MTIDDSALRDARVRLKAAKDTTRWDGWNALIDEALELLEEPADTNSPAGDTFTALPSEVERCNIPEVERCNIQEVCSYPMGHLGNCEWVLPGGVDVEDAREPHGWPNNPEAIQSGKLTFYICPRCHCVEQHAVHGWAPKEAPAIVQPQGNVESVDFLLSRLCLLMPEPSLMDIEDGGKSLSLLLQRTQALATLHQAKQLERIADALDQITNGTVIQTRDVDRAQVYSKHLGEKLRPDDKELPGPWQSAGAVIEE